MRATIITVIGMALLVGMLGSKAFALHCEHHGSMPTDYFTGQETSW